MAEVTLTDEEREYIRSIIQGLNPREDLVGAMLSKTDAVPRFKDRAEKVLLALASKLDKIDWDALEDVGHAFTHLHHLHGQSWYVCENCGAVMVVENSEIVLFHSPPHVDASAARCVQIEGPQRTSLKEKIQILIDRDIERLNRI